MYTCYLFFVYFFSFLFFFQPVIFYLCYLTFTINVLTLKHFNDWQPLEDQLFYSVAEVLYEIKSVIKHFLDILVNSSDLYTDLFLSVEYLLPSPPLAVSVLSMQVLSLHNMVGKGPSNNEVLNPRIV